MSELYDWEFMSFYGNSDANLYEAGVQECPPGYTMDYYVCKYNIIHINVAGKGILKLGNRQIPVEAGQGMFTPAYSLVNYLSDEQSPLTYAWFHFSGIKFNEYLNVAQINLQNPVFDIANPYKQCMRILNMMDLAREGGPSMEPKIFSLAHEVFASIIEDNPRRSDDFRFPDYIQDHYVGAAIEYMREHLAQRLTIADIAAHLNLNPNYFSTIFKRSVGVPPQNYMVNLRLQSACVMLLNTSDSINQIAHAVGYESTAAFSKAFTKFYNASPRLYRLYGLEDRSSLFTAERMSRFYPKAHVALRKPTPKI